MAKKNSSFKYFLYGVIGYFVLSLILDALGITDGVIRFGIFTTIVLTVLFIPRKPNRKK